MYKFIPDDDLLRKVAFDVYNARLETGGQPPQDSEEKRRNNSVIYMPIVRDCFHALHNSNTVTLGEVVKVKGRKTNDQ